MLIIICMVLCKIGALGNIVIYEENRKEFLSKELGIYKILSKSDIRQNLKYGGWQRGRKCSDRDLRKWFGTDGEVVLQ